MHRLRMVRQFKDTVKQIAITYKVDDEIDLIFAQEL